LVHYPEALIAKMRNLSLGSKMLATYVGRSGDDAFIRVTEVNGVAVVLTSADIKICKQNRFAKTISFFIIQIPEELHEKFRVELDPVKVCANSQTVRLSLTESKSVSDYLLGAKIKHQIELKGYDEIGRTVSVHLAF
jgi:predicted alpha/beta-fold hydrolase